MWLRASELSSIFELISVGKSRKALSVDMDVVEQEEDRVVNIFQVFKFDDINVLGYWLKIQFKVLNI